MAKKNQYKKVTLLSTPANGAKKTMWRAGRMFEVKSPQVLELTKEEVEVFKNDKRFKLSKASEADIEGVSSEATSGSESDSFAGITETEEDATTEDSDSEDSSSDEAEKVSSNDTEVSRVEGLLKLSREELNAKAVSLNVENPEKLENKTEVAQAIVEAEAQNAESGATS